MLKSAIIYTAKWFIFIGLMIFLKCSSSTKADLVIHNGTIYTVDDSLPVAEMVAVKDGRIVHVGTAREKDQWLESTREVLDLQGRTMTPGFIESHAHFIGLGKARMRLDLTATQSYEEMIAKVAEAVKRAEPGEWILGRGWHQSKWSPLPEKMVRGFQTHEALSAVSPDHPVFLTHASGHAAIANARAMEIAGITPQTTVEGDGEVIRDDDGHPTGIFTENAMELIQRHVPEGTPEMLEKAMDLAMQACLENGITSFHDAGTVEEEIELFKRYLLKGKLKVRLYVMLESEKDGEFHEAFLRRWYERGPEIGLGDHFLTIRAIKLHADGALGSRGAWLLAEYSDRPGHFGNETLPMEIVCQVARDGLQYGFQVCTHAIGDRTNREVLDCYEQAFVAFPEKAKNARFRIEHAQHLNASDIPRFGQLGVIASMQAIHMSSDRPWALERLGIERIEEGAYVWQKLLQSGAVIINGTDAPVEPLNPIACFYAAVTRRTLEGNPPGGFEPSQKMTRPQALRSYTLDAAYGAFEEALKGSITPGKLADFTVFSQDIMTIPEDELLNTRVDFTIVNGNIVYRR